MKTIGATSKLGKYFLQRYEQAPEKSDLSFIYKKPSARKLEAFQQCKNMCDMGNGKNLKVLSGNTFTFSVAWQTAKGLRIETAYQSYLVKL